MPFEIVIPRLGWSMEEGTFLGWLKAEGTTIKAGDILFELEGEKASQEIEAVDGGILRFAPDAPAKGAVVPVGKVIGYLLAVGESLPSAGSSPSAPAATGTAPSKEQAPAAGPAARRRARELGVPLEQVQGSGPRGRVLSNDIQKQAEKATQKDSVKFSGQKPVATPRARHLAKQLGIDWKSLSGSGKEGRIREADIKAAAQSGHSTSSRRLPISSRRKTIAHRMVASRSQTVPVTLTTRADATNLVNLREQFKAAGRSTRIPSYQDIVQKLVAELLVQHPLLAGQWQETEILLPSPDAIHIGIAVDTPDGLLVPVVRSVRSLTLSDLAQQTFSLAERARQGQLSPGRDAGRRLYDHQPRRLRDRCLHTSDQLTRVSDSRPGCHPLRAHALCRWPSRPSPPLDA
ncbi:MAG: 2-oxo acid dehydrogenase subunit E2 [Pirellulales bacterium]